MAQRARKKDTAMAAANDDTQENGETAAAPAKPKGVVTTDEKATVQAKYEFTEKELKDIAKELAESHSDLGMAEEEKKAAVSNFKDKVDRIKLRITTLSRHYRDGFEMRDHNCIVIYDYKKREKRFKSVDTKKIVEVRPFAPGDEQRRFDFHKEEA